MRKSKSFEQGTLDALLFTAAGYGKSEAIPFLIECGADIHASNDLALYTAAGVGDASAVRMLLALGANARAREDRALRAAAAEGHADVLGILAQHLKRAPSAPFGQPSV